MSDGSGQEGPRGRSALPLVVIGAAVAAAFATGAITRWMEGGPPPPPVRVDAHLRPDAGALPRVAEALAAGRVAVGVDLAGGPPDGRLEAALGAAGVQGPRVRVFAGLDWSGVGEAGWPEAAVAALERARALGAAGLTVAPPGAGAQALPALDDPRLDPVFEAAARLGLPVALVRPDCAGPPPDPTWLAALDRRLARHPEGRFVGTCFAGLAEDPGRALALLDAHRNLYLDTAGALGTLARPDTRRAARRVFVRHPDRVLFASGRRVLPADPTGLYDGLQALLASTGTGLPDPDGGAPVEGLGLPKDVVAAVLGENAARLLGLDLPDPEDTP